MSNLHKNRKYTDGMVFPNKKYGDMLITEYVKWDEVYIKFLVSGYENKVSMVQVKKGNCVDPTQYIPKLKGIEFGSIYPTMRYGDIEVLSYSREKQEVFVRFVNTGFERYCRAEDIRRGFVRDYSANCTEQIKGFVGSVMETSKSILTVTGVKENPKLGNVKYHVHCTVCSQDKELYPEGLHSTKLNWINGFIPCACSGYKRHNEEQHIIRLNRLLEDKPSKVLRFIDFKNISSEVEVYCEKHNFKTVTLASYIYSGTTGCKVCGIYNNRMSIVESEILKRGRDTPEVFYILRVNHLPSSKSFIKSGICKFKEDVECSIKERYKNTKEYGDYTYEILYTEEGSYDNISKLEILSQTDNYEYSIPSEDMPYFVGYTECFSNYTHDGVMYSK